jgi:hypothetical protein
LGEEKYLVEKYCDDYKEYCRYVPRFFPWIKPYRNGNVKQPVFKPKDGFRSEKRSLQAFASVSIIVVIIWIIKN